MKLSTHNLLVCNKNTCINNEKNYPLIIKASKVNTVKSDFDEAMIAAINVLIEKGNQYFGKEKEEREEKEEKL